MKLLSSRVIKNCKISLGAPFVVEAPDNELIIDESTYQAEYSTVSIYTKDVIEDAQKQAQIILMKAKNEVLRILKEAEKERNEGKKAVELATKQGYDDGFSEGYNKGYSEGYKEIAAKFEQGITNIELIKEQALDDYRQLLANAESDAVDVILEITREVLKKELSNRENMFGIIKEAFDRCSDDKGLVLRVSPEDYNYLSENRHKLELISEKVLSMNLKKDTSLKAGGCIIC